MKWTTSIFALAAFGLAACGGGESEEPAAPETAAPEMAAEETPTPEVVDPVAGSVAHPDRPADDVEGDERRKPAETRSSAPSAGSDWPPTSCRPISTGC